jgi:hypothetical protein
VDGGDDAVVDLVVVVALDPRRVETNGGRSSVAGFDVEEFPDL